MTFSLSKITHQSEYKSPEYSAVFIIYLAIFCIYALLSFYTPLQVDDLAFMRYYLDFNEGDAGFSFEALGKYADLIRDNDNSRLGNIVAPLVDLSPAMHYLFPIIVGISVCLIVGIIRRLIMGPGQKVFSLMAVWGVFAIFLPWRNGIMIWDYSLNYIISSALTLLFIKGLLRFEKDKMPLPMLLGMSILAILSGGWHEGFAFPTLAGMGVWALVRKFRMCGQWWLVSGLYLLSAIAFGISPGIVMRALTGGGSVAETSWLKIAFDLLLPILLICSFGGMLLFKRGRAQLSELFSKPVVLICFPAMVVGVVISVAFNHTPRTAFYPDLLAIVLLGLIYLEPVYMVLSKGWRIFIGSVIFAILIAHGCIAVIWQHKLFLEYEEIVRVIANGDSPTVYRDILMPEWVPIYALRYPVGGTWVEPFQYKVVRLYYGDERIAVVPEALRDAMPENSRKLAEGMYERGEAVYSNSEDLAEAIGSATDENDEWTAQLVYLDIALNDGSIRYSAPTLMLPYESESGDRRYYFKPFNLSGRDIDRIILENGE